MEANARVHVIIHGRVQGVFFRLKTQAAARQYGANGWVRNLPDGTVEAVMEGSPKAVESLLAWCNQGPRLARVEKVDISRESYTGGYNDFKVTH